MFDQINGLPVHVLVLHAAVIFVPLLALGALVYAVVPRWRSKIGWAVALLAVIAPLSTLVAKLSGTKLYNRLIDQGLSGRGKEILDDHMSFGTTTWWLSLALGLVTLVMVGLTVRSRTPDRTMVNAGAGAGGSGGATLARESAAETRTAGVPRIVEIVLAIAMVVLAALAGYYVFRTGDAGATAVWGQY
ncbi:hypothetical protein HH310_03625 [Actinoplanes sp. TBRC 11911]|uniref:DUF2231 domain-containing protein n=1 Tax=Actinoplanes sp. TBRC 11911 TaxID=2729386 RepID=UPI00145D97F0|nr:DUF2231 domain-containing protein [Actinoplanes sp. TBRC 11911]NMO50283.1 hypothetical protein [Actinoplanes sp. TBRC 11911]